MNEEVIEHFKKLYPDEMVTSDMGIFERAKLAGKVELLTEMIRFIDEEYGTKLGH